MCHVMFRLRRCFLMFDRERTVMRSHFPVVLSGNRVDSPLCPILEHPGSFNQILGAGHGTPLMQMLPLYVGRPAASCAMDAVQIGVFDRFRPIGCSSNRRQPKPAHLHQPRPAIPAVKQADQGPHDRTPLLDHGRDHRRGSISGGFLRLRKMASSAPPNVSGAGQG